MKKEFIDRLGKELLFLDGAIGTVLQERGLGAGELPELWNFKKEDEILNRCNHKFFAQNYGTDLPMYWMYSSWQQCRSFLYVSVPAHIRQKKPRQERPHSKNGVYHLDA